VLSTAIRSFGDPDVAPVWPEELPGVASDPLVCCGGAAGDLLPPPKREGDDTHEHKQYGNPEPTERGGESSNREESYPQEGDRELEREQDQSEESNPTLFPVGQPGGDARLVGIIDALAVLDGAADARPSVVIEAILEDKPPPGIASLLNHVVHRGVAPIVLPAWRARPVVRWPSRTSGSDASRLSLEGTSRARRVTTLTQACATATTSSDG
jgi:hypothetical protein